MEILILFAVATSVVWGLICFRCWEKTKLKLLPTLGVVVVLTGCVFSYDFFRISVGPLPLTLDRVLLITLVACFVYQFFGERENIRPVNAADLVLLTTVAVLFVNAFTHDWRYKEHLPVSRLIFFYLLPLALYLVMRHVRIGLPELKFIAFAIAGLAVYLGATAFAETRMIEELVFPGYIMDPGEFYGRGRGPLLNPVINGMLMVAGCCCLWMGWAKGSQNVRVLIVGLTAVVMLGVFCTYTRSVWLGFAACAALFIFFPADRRTKGKLWLVGIVGLALSFPLIGEKVFSFKRDQAVTQTEMELSAKLRPLFIQVAWKMFQDRPLSGCGFGQYSREKYPYLKTADADQLMMTKSYLQHNVFLAYLVETGLIGVSVLLAMLVTMAMQSWKLWHNHQQDLTVRQFGLLMLAMLLNYVINGMFHDVSIIPMANLVLLFLFGIVNNLNTAVLENAPAAPIRFADPRHGGLTAAAIVGR